MVAFKRTEGFRFVFETPLSANFVILIDGKPENFEKTRYPCEILDVSPHGMKIFTAKEIIDSGKVLQVEVHFILDEIMIKGVGEIVWTKSYGSKFQYGLFFNEQPKLEELIVSELKLRRKKEIKRRK